MESLRIAINPEKSSVILFGSKTEKKIKVKINETEVKQVNQHKYLGYIIDQKLNHNPHIDYITKKS